MANKQITTLGQLKVVDSKTLSSGDKQITIKMIVVGKEVVEAAKFADLPANAIVVITYDPKLSFN